MPKHSHFVCGCQLRPIDPIRHAVSAFRSRGEVAARPATWVKVSKNMAKFGSNLSIPGLAIALCAGVGIIAARHWLSEPKAASSQSTVLGANSMLQMKQAIANHQRVLAWKR